MKVFYEGPSAVEHPQCGVLIEPGWNEYPEGVAKTLLAAKVVVKHAPNGWAPPKPKTIEPAPEAPGSAPEEPASSGSSRKEAK